MSIHSKNKNSSPDIKTFGCRLNIWESQVINDHAIKHGHSDLIIFNTCAVTSEAERQARQAIRSAKKNRSDAKILVTGCAAQIDPNKWKKMPEVNFVTGRPHTSAPNADSLIAASAAASSTKRLAAARRRGPAARRGRR